MPCCTAALTAGSGVESILFAALALARLTRHDDVSQRDVLERLILAADKRNTSRLNPPSPAWYMRVTP